MFSVLKRWFSRWGAPEAPAQDVSAGEQRANPSPATSDTPRPDRDTFLRELRGIPSNRNDMDRAKNEFLNELRRIANSRNLLP